MPARRCSPRPALLAKRKSGIPADFVVRLFASRADDLDRYSAEALAGIAERSWAFLAERTAGVPKSASNRPLRCQALPCLRSSTTICRFWSIRRRELNRAASISAYWSIRCSRRARFRGPADQIYAGAPRRGSRESFIHLHIEGADDAGAAP